MEGIKDNKNFGSFPKSIQVNFRWGGTTQNEKRGGMTQREIRYLGNLDDNFTTDELTLSPEQLSSADVTASSTKKTSPVRLNHHMTLPQLEEVL